MARRMTSRMRASDRNKSWLTIPSPRPEASITLSPSRSSSACSTAPTRVIPPASRPDNASARSLVAATTVILDAKRSDALNR